jgi:acyl-CoA thioesterase-1
VRYLALGDSYTIGTGASDEAHNYPSILAARLARETGKEVAITNPAVNGFTTLDVIGKELSYLARLKPQLVSVLIGVNDLVQGRTPEEYRSSLVEIYDAIVSSGVPARCVAAISLPEWSVVPAASSYGSPARLRRLTTAFNAIARQEAMARNFEWVDITEASTSRPASPGWISPDDLHPGDIQYAAWADVIWEAIRDRWVSAANG